MRFIKTISAALAVTVGALSFAGSAEARDRDGPRWRHHGGHHHGWRHHHNHNNAFVGGVIGFGAGALIGSALARPYYYQPAPVYAAPVYQPAPVYYAAAPWTPGWYSYCRTKYRSFNPSTGYFVGYDGQSHLCR